MPVIITSECIYLTNYISNIKEHLYHIDTRNVILDCNIYINMQGGEERPHKRVNNLVNFKHNYLENIDIECITNQRQVSFRMVCLKDIFR